MVRRGMLSYFGDADVRGRETGVSGARGALAQLLMALKQRSGLSYSELGRQSHLSSSTVHRYCSAATLPPDYQTVVRIATACAATDRELVELLHHWRLATGQAT